MPNAPTILKRGPTIFNTNYLGRNTIQLCPIAKLYVKNVGRVLILTDRRVSCNGMDLEFYADHEYMNFMGSPANT